MATLRSASPGVVQQDDPSAAGAPRPGTPSFSVVIATLRRPDSLRTTLKSVLACDPAPDEIVIVDGDAERSARRVVEESASSGVRVRYACCEPGLTRQRNRGLDAASGDVIVFLDDDVFVDSRVFRALSRAYADDSIVGATGRVIEGADRRLAGKESRLRRLLPGGGEEGRFTRFGYPRRLERRADRPVDVEFMQGCFMTARADAARRIRFDERLSGYGLAEDEDFSYRLSRLGRIRYLPDALVNHENTGFASRDRRAFNRAVVLNRAYLFRKNFPQTRLARAQFGLLLLIFGLHRALNRDWQGLRGLIDGVKDLRPDVATAGSAAPVPVVFVSSHARLGGSERYLVTLLDHIGGDWISCVVALENGPLVADLRARGHVVDVVPTGARWIDAVASARRLRKILRSRDASVVHANGIKAAAVSVLATWPRGPRVVWVKHDFSWDGWPARLVAALCDHVVGVSAATLSTFRRKRKCHVVHSGIVPRRVDRTAARAALAPEVGSETNAVVVLVGRLHPAKGQLELVEAAPDVLREAPGVRFVFVGSEDVSTPGYAALVRRRISELGLDAAFVELGHREDVAGIVSASDVGVIPSVADDRGMGREGFGLVALELMAAGTPVVAYADGGIPEVVGDCGLLVPPGDHAALARAIVRLLRDAELVARLTRCGERRVAARFGVSQMVEGLRARYLEAARR